MNNLAYVLGSCFLAACVNVTFAGGAGGGGGGRGGRGAGGGGFNNGGPGAGAPMNGDGFQAGPGGGGGGRAGPNGPMAAFGNLGINFAFYNSEFDILTQQINLSPEQASRVRERVDAMNVELQSLLQQSGGGRGGRGGQPGGPAGPGGPGGPGGARGADNGNPQPNLAPGVGPEQIKLRDSYLALADSHQVKITAELMPDQKLQWEQFKLELLINPKLALVTLTDEQKNRIRGLVLDTAKVLAALTDGKEIQTFEGRLYRRIVSEVLTEPQAAKLIDMPPGGGGGGGQGPNNAAVQQALAQAQASLQAAQAALNGGNPGGPPNGPGDGGQGRGAGRGGRGGRGGAGGFGGGVGGPPPENSAP